MRLQERAATDLGFTRDRHSMCASRASPTCVFETPRAKLRNLDRPKITAPHHEAGRDRRCIRLVGSRCRVADLIRGIFLMILSLYDVSIQYIIPAGLDRRALEC